MKRNRAVMEDHAPAEVAADDPRRALWRKLEWFATPPWASRAGAELIRRLNPMADSVWEPACGDGIMAECFREFFPDVFASDIHPQGAIGAKIDFLDPAGELGELNIDVDWVATNPPFEHAMAFLNRARSIARVGVALLGRLALLEGGERYRDLYGPVAPLTVFAPFSERVPMQLGPWNPDCSTATAYAWFVFTHDQKEGWAPRVHPIPPGTRDRLSRKTDASRFAAKKEAPLFEHNFSRL